LIGGDQPFIAPWEEVVTELAPMRPPRVSVGTKAHKPGFGIPTEFEVGSREDVGHRGPPGLLLARCCAAVASSSSMNLIILGFFNRASPC